MGVVCQIWLQNTWDTLDLIKGGMSELLPWEFANDDMLLFLFVAI